MTPTEAADGWIAGKRRVVLIEFTDDNGNVTLEEPGELLGPDSDTEDREEMIHGDIWLVDVVRFTFRVPASEMRWE